MIEIQDTWWDNGKEKGNSIELTTSYMLKDNSIDNIGGYYQFSLSISTYGDDKNEIKRENNIMFSVLCEQLQKLNSEIKISQSSEAENFSRELKVLSIEKYFKESSGAWYAQKAEKFNKYSFKEGEFDRRKFKYFVVLEDSDFVSELIKLRDASEEVLHKEIINTVIQDFMFNFQVWDKNVLLEQVMTLLNTDKKVLLQTLIDDNFKKVDI